MTYSMKSKNKLEGDSNFRAWKTRIDLVLAKNKVLDIVKGKIMEPQFEEGKEKEPQNVAVMEYHSGFYKRPLDTLHLPS